jgi:hypothetical protein
MRGRPPQTPRNKRVNVRLPNDLFDRLQELRTDTDMTFTEIVVDRLRKALGLKTPTERLDEAET